MTFRCGILELWSILYLKFSSHEHLFIFLQNVVLLLLVEGFSRQIKVFLVLSCLHKIEGTFRMYYNLVCVGRVAISVYISLIYFSHSVRSDLRSLKASYFLSKDGKRGTIGECRYGLDFVVDFLDAFDKLFFIVMKKFSHDIFLQQT